MLTVPVLGFLLLALCSQVRSPDPRLSYTISCWSDTQCPDHYRCVNNLCRFKGPSVPPTGPPNWVREFTFSPFSHRTLANPVRNTRWLHWILPSNWHLCVWSLPYKVLQSRWSLPLWHSMRHTYWGEALHSLIWKNLTSCEDNHMSLIKIMAISSPEEWSALWPNKPPSSLKQPRSGTWKI